MDKDEDVKLKALSDLENQKGGEFSKTFGSISSKEADTKIDINEEDLPNFIKQER